MATKKRIVRRVRKVYDIKLVSGPITLTIKGTTFRRGVTIPITDVDIIYKAQLSSDFSCIDKTPGAKPKKAAPAPPPPPPPEEDEDDEDQLDDEEDPDEEDEKDDGEANPSPSRSDLKKLKKDALVDYAEENGIEIDPDASKATIIDTILDAYDD